LVDVTGRGSLGRDNSELKGLEGGRLGAGQINDVSAYVVQKITHGK
jgi:hypothetical protein